MGNIQTGDKQIKTGKSPAKSKNFIRNLNRRSSGRDNKKQDKKRIDARQPVDRDKSPGSDVGTAAGVDSCDEGEGEWRGGGGGGEVTDSRSATCAGAGAERSPGEARAVGPGAAPRPLDPGPHYYSAETSPHDAGHIDDMPQLDMDKEKNAGDNADRSDDVMGAIWSRGAKQERNTHECFHEFRENRLKGSPGTTSFTVSKHRKVELPPAAVLETALLDTGSVDIERRLSSGIEATPESNVLRKVASLTLEKLHESRHSRPAGARPPDKLDCQIYDKFEGQMLLNWFASSSESNNLRSYLSAQDLKNVGIHFCTSLLTVGVLRQIPDKDAPTENVFKPNLMYYWAHTEVPMSQPVTPGRLQASKWPPSQDFIAEPHTMGYFNLDSNKFDSQNNNQEINELSDLKAISHLKIEIQELELAKVRLLTEIENLKKSNVKEEINAARRVNVQVENKETQTVNDCAVICKTNENPVIMPPESERAVVVGAGGTQLALDSVNKLSPDTCSNIVNSTTNDRSDNGVENYCKLNKSRESTNISREEAKSANNIVSTLSKEVSSESSSDTSFKSTTQECLVNSVKQCAPIDSQTNVIYMSTASKKPLQAFDSTTEMSVVSAAGDASAACDDVTASTECFTSQSLVQCSNASTSPSVSLMNLDSSATVAVSDVTTTVTAEIPVSCPAPPPPPLPETVFAPPPPPMPNVVIPAAPPPPPMPDMGPPPPPMPGMGPPPPPMPGMGPPPPPMPGMGPPPPPMPGMGPPPPPMPGMGPPPPPMPGMGPPPPPMPGMGPPPPPMPGAGPPPPPPLQGGCPPPPPPPAAGPAPFPAPPAGGWTAQRATLRKSAIKPAAPMKPLYWTRILAAPPPATPPGAGPAVVAGAGASSGAGAGAAVDDTDDAELPAAPLWLQIDEAPLENINEFAELFSRQVVAAPAKKKSSEVKSKLKPIKVLDSKRSQNVGILAQSLHVDFAEIENAIYNFDTSIVSLEALQQIYELRPTEEEVSQIRAEVSAAPGRPLDRPEQFLLELAGLPRLAERVDCLLAHTDLHDAIQALSHKLDNFRRVCDFLMKNEDLKCVFSIILTLGNYMNGGNGVRGQADGFGLEILSKLKDVKSKAHNVTLLHYVVRVYCSRRGGALSAALPVPEPGDVARALALDLAHTADHIAHLQDSVHACTKKTELILSETPPDAESQSRAAVFRDKMSTFLSSATARLAAEEAALNSARRRFTALLRYYQAKPQDPQDFFALWINFCADFKDIFKKEEQIALKEKLKEAKKQQGERRPPTQPKKEGGLKARLQKISSQRK